MRALLVAPFVALAACGASPCDGIDGACLGVRITNGPAIDQLALSLHGAVEYAGTTPEQPGKLRTPPLETAIELPADAMGTLEVDAIGLREGVELSRAVFTTSITPGGRATVDLALVAAAGDAGSDLRDAAVTDLSSTDALAVRHVFLATAHDGALGSETAIDGECTAQAHDHAIGASGAGWHAIIMFGGDGGDPEARLSLSSGRPVVLPSGALVVDGDEYLFHNAHLFAGGIDELATGQKVANACVWTAFDNGGFAEPAMGRCSNWSDASDMGTGYAGSSTWDMQMNWTFASVQPCNASCYVYCLED